MIVSTHNVSPAVSYMARRKPITVATRQYQIAADANASTPERDAGGFIAKIKGGVQSEAERVKNRAEERAQATARGMLDQATDAADQAAQQYTNTAAGVLWRTGGVAPSAGNPGFADQNTLDSAAEDETPGGSYLPGASGSAVSGAAIVAGLALVGFLVLRKRR